MSGGCEIGYTYCRDACGVEADCGRILQWMNDSRCSFGGNIGGAGAGRGLSFDLNVLGRIIKE